MDTFLGRYKYFLEVSSSEKCIILNSTIKEYQRDVSKLLLSEHSEQYVESKMSKTAYNEYRHKRIVMGSSVHPDTGEIIPWPTRISSFVPTNVPIMIGILLSKTIQGTIFW